MVELKREENYAGPPIAVKLMISPVQSGEGTQRGGNILDISISGTNLFQAFRLRASETSVHMEDMGAN